MLIIPNDPQRPGGEAERHAQGFTLLAKDEKAALVRLDKNFSNSPIATCDKLVYCAITRSDDLRVIREATEDDRYKRFRRPAYLDKVVVTCCDHPARYLSIYDEDSGSYFDLNVDPKEAKQQAKHLYFHFYCEKCCTAHTSPMDLE